MIQHSPHRKQSNTMALPPSLPVCHLGYGIEAVRAKIESRRLHPKLLERTVLFLSERKSVQSRFRVQQAVEAIEPSASRTENSTTLCQTTACLIRRRASYSVVLPYPTVAQRGHTGRGQTRPVLGLSPAESTTHLSRFWCVQKRYSYSHRKPTSANKQNNDTPFVDSL